MGCVGVALRSLVRSQPVCPGCEGMGALLVRRRRAVWLLVVIIAVMAGCGGEKPVPPKPPEPERGTLRRVWLPYTPGDWDQRGVAVANGACALSLGWHYDWTETPPLCGTSVGIPMVYCQARDADIPAGSLLFAMNEPDRADQCALSPTYGAMAWRAIEERYPTARLIGPAVSHDGETWLLRWYDEYQRLYGTTPRIWAMNVHCYATAHYCQDWIEWNSELGRQWTASKQVWVTEWGMLPCWWPADGVAKALAEAEQLRAWMESNRDVAGYAWFASYVPESSGPPAGFGPGCNTSLVDEQGRLTRFGSWYGGK